MSDSGKALLGQIIENWQGVLVTVFVINLLAPLFLVTWMLLQQGGYVSSDSKNERDEIYKKVTGNQVLLSGLYYQEFAKCMQNAAKEAKEEGWYLQRLELACKEADNRMVRHMATLEIKLSDRSLPAEN